MAGDVCIGPQPLPNESEAPVINLDFNDIRLADDIKRAVAGVPDVTIDLGRNNLGNALSAVGKTEDVAPAERGPRSCSRRWNSYEPYWAWNSGAKSSISSAARVEAHHVP